LTTVYLQYSSFQMFVYLSILAQLCKLTEMTVKMVLTAPIPMVAKTGPVIPAPLKISVE